MSKYASHIYNHDRLLPQCIIKCKMGNCPGQTFIFELDKHIYSYHLDLIMLYNQIPCVDWNCQWTGKTEDELNEHRKNSCEYRTVKCDHCEWTGTYHDMYNIIVKHFRKCNNAGCKWVGCEKTIKNHENECEFRKIKCDLCRKEISGKAAYTVHWFECYEDFKRKYT